MRTLLLGTVAIVLSASATQAAPFDGWYVGIAGGGGWAESRVSATNLHTQTQTLNGSGAIIGGTLGINFQQPTGWVWGVEGDMSWSGMKPSGHDAAVFPTCTTGGLGTCSVDMNWLGTLRGRIGFLVTPSTLIYATGGLAFADLKVVNASSGGTFHGSGTEAGWTVGGGVEFALAPKWTAKAEYLHTDLGSGPSFACNGLVPHTCSSDFFRADIVRVGLNFHF